MKNNNVLEFAGRDVISDLLTALLRSGAQQLIAQPVEAELEELLGQHSDRRTDEDNAAVMTQCKGGVYFFLLCFVSREINISISKIKIAYLQKLIVSI